MFETGIISAPIQILETPTTLFLLSPRHLQFFNSRKSSVIAFESPVFKALICSQHVFAASRSRVTKVDMTDVSCVETSVYDIDITNIALFRSRLVIVQDMFVNIQGAQEECFDYSVAAVDATDSYLFVVLSDGSLYRYSTSFEYLRKVKSAFDVKASDVLFVANDRSKIDVLDLDGRQIRRVKAPGMVLKLVVGDTPGQDAASSGRETTSILGSSLAVLVGVDGAREIVFYSSEYSIISRLGCLDCFFSGYNMYVRMSHSEYDALCLNKLRPFIRSISRMYKCEYYTIGVGGRSMYLLRNEAILNSVELDEEIVDVVFLGDGSTSHAGDSGANGRQEHIFVVCPRSIAKVADLPSLDLVHVMDFEFTYGVCGSFAVVSAGRQVLLFDLSTEEVVEETDEEFYTSNENTAEYQETQHGQAKHERVYRKIVFREEFYKLRSDGVLLVGDESFAGVCDFMVSDRSLVLLSRDDVRMYRIENECPDGKGLAAEQAEAQVSGEDSGTATGAESAVKDGDENGAPEMLSARDSEEGHDGGTRRQGRRFELIASMPVQYEEYAFGASTLFLCSKTGVVGVGDKVVHRQESADSIYTYWCGDGFVALRKGGRFSIYNESEFVNSEVSRMRAVNLSHDDFNFRAFVEREEMLETLERGAKRLSARAEEYASAARRARDKIRKKKYWFF